MSASIQCEDCGEDVQLNKTDTAKLFVSCKCSDRMIRVSKVLPEGWNDE